MGAWVVILTWFFFLFCKLLSLSFKSPDLWKLWLKSWWWLSECPRCPSLHPCTEAHLCCSGRTTATHKYISTWSVHWKMKGGNLGRFLGGQFSFFLSALVFTTIFLWSWEKNPLLTNLLSAQDQFIMQPSGLYLIENLWVLITCQSCIFHD